MCMEFRKMTLLTIAAWLSLFVLMGCSQDHVLVKNSDELRAALEKSAKDELVIKIGESITDIKRPFVYEGKADLRLEGNGAELISGGRCRILHIKSQVRLTLEGLSFSKGRTGVRAQRGGAVYHEFGDVYILDSVFLDNSAEWGGAVYVKGSVEVRGSRFEFNQARWKGGAIYSKKDIIISDSVVQNNSAPQLYQGDSSACLK